MRITTLALCALLVGSHRLTLAHVGLRVDLIERTCAAVQGADIVSQLRHLASFSDTAFPEVTRLLFTPADSAARAYVKGLMQDADMTVREDAMGNIWGSWPGSESGRLGAVATGSHCDAIPKSGMYDGTVGVIGAIAAMRALQAAGFQPRRTLEVVMFTSEEPTRFGLSCVGSRAMAGALSEEVLSNLRDENGTSYLQAAQAAGVGAPCASDLLTSTRLGKGEIDYFVELHIEQGPVLEQQQRDIGVVTAIAAPATLRVAFHGEGGHAGGQLMHLRNDASLAAAELALAVEAAVHGTLSPDTVGTAGSWRITPNAVNSVPRDAILEIDVRDVSEARRDQVLRSVRRAAEEIAERRKVRAALTLINQDPPASCDREVMNAIRQAADVAPFVKRMDMVSRAYHDSLFMAQTVKTGMIFIPCRQGWSHRPDEFVEPDAIAKGVRVLALTMALLSETGPEDDGHEL